MDTTEGPNLNVVKPERKLALSGDTAAFVGCLSQDQVNAVKTTTVNDGIHFIDSALSKEECDILCKAVDSSAVLSFWSPQGRNNEDVRRFRDADTIELNSPIIAQLLWDRLGKTIEQELNLSMSIEEDQSDPNWERELVGQWLPTNFNHDLLLARYPSGGAFAPHTDGRAIHDFNTRSFYSVIIFLNTIPKGSGGGTRFYTAEAVHQLAPHTNAEGKVHWSSDASIATNEVDAVAGRLLLFHQSLVHEGVPPISPHQKYIIRSDIMFSRTPPICNSAADQAAYALFKQAEDLAEEGRVDEAVPLFKKALKLSPQMAQIMGQG